MYPTRVITLVPPRLVAVNETVKTPPVRYVCVAFFTEEKVPSPKFHRQVAHTAGSLVEGPALKDTVSGAVPFTGVPVKLGIGGAGGGTAFTVTVLTCVDVAFPPVFITVRVTVYVPGIS